MLNKLVFKIGYLLREPDILRYYGKFQQSQWQSLDWHVRRQEKQLRVLINFAYKNVPYYTKLFDRLKIRPSDISSIKDLEKLPVLTKKIIKENWRDLIPKNIDKIRYFPGSTGGSTGNTLKYRVSKEDYERGRALLFRGWGYAGYELGDKVAVIAGSSLIPTARSIKIDKIKSILLSFRPFRKYSSYEMSEENLFKYFHDIDKWKPDFIRGYASSVYLFSKFIKGSNLKLSFKPKAVFTTAEYLFDKQSKLIEKVLGVKVFDTYGLNDGGISAYECEKHNGFHTDMERGILEVVNDKGRQLTGKRGKILATSLFNYAMPFIRYDTGDLGVVSSSRCACGRKLPLLKELSGRVTDFLRLNGTVIGSPVLTVLMGKFDIEQYQIVQDTQKSLIIKIIKGKDYVEDRDEDMIKKSFFSHVGEIDIKFDYLNSIPVPKAEKYKFIINKVREN